MADNNEVTPQRNEWEVVKLTASAYEAAPSAAKVNEDNGGQPSTENEAELAHAMFMSHHFVFPPSEHENLPLENESNCMAFDLVADNATSSGVDEEDWTDHDEFPGINEEHSAHGAGTSVTDATDSCDQGLSLSNSNSDDSARLEKSYMGERVGLPCEAWWKRRAVSFYAHARETNSFWSLFVAATVMGLVIVRQHWQRESWQTLQIKWQSSINSGNAGRLLGPITRLKDVIVSSQRRLV